MKQIWWGRRVCPQYVDRLWTTHAGRTVRAGLPPSKGHRRSSEVHEPVAGWRRPGRPRWHTPLCPVRVREPLAPGCGLRAGARPSHHARTSPGAAWTAGCSQRWRGQTESLVAQGPEHEVGARVRTELSQTPGVGARSEVSGRGTGRERKTPRARHCGAGWRWYRYRDSNPGYRRERAAS